MLTFVSTKYNNDTQFGYSKVIIWKSWSVMKHKITQELFESLPTRYHRGLETSTKGINFGFS